MRRTLPLTICLYILAPGCGDTVGGLETTSTGSTSTGAAIPTTSTGETPTTTGSSSTTFDACGDRGTGFIQKVDVPGPECDTFKQDCGPGQKCTPWGSGGGPWDALKCVPVTGDRAPGESCTVEGEDFSGIDDCIAGAMCLYVDDESHGRCVALCIGCENQPTCADPENFFCAVNGDGIVNPCVQLCDPLIQDCPDDQLCVPDDFTYLCEVAFDDAAVFEPCDFSNSCAKGLLCGPGGAASECSPNLNCCLPMCSLADGGKDCPGAGQVCLPLYDPPPESYEDVGYCSLMP